MLLPLGDMSGAQPEVPAAIKEGYASGWWALTFLFVLNAVGAVVALDVFAGLLLAMFAFWCYYMTAANCEAMTQSCMFSFGFLCCLQSIFGLVNLCSSINGRTKKTISANPSSGDPKDGGTPFFGSGSTTHSFTTTIETTPFFDHTQGWHYNFQSAMLIASFVLMLLGATLAYVTYKAYPNSLFDDDGGENQGFMSQSQAGSRYGVGSFGGAGQTVEGRPSRPGGGSHRPVTEPRQQLFSGSGHTLGH